MVMSVRPPVAWNLLDLRRWLDVSEWRPFLRTIPRDPYVEQRWKRMSWLTLTPTGEVTALGPCPMAQGRDFNDTDTMGDVVRHYAPLEDAFLERADVQRFVQTWAAQHGIGPGEPIMLQLNGVRGAEAVDPLQGQAIHSDGYEALGMMVIHRDNVRGGVSRLFADPDGQRQLTERCLMPGELLCVPDLELFHTVTPIEPEDPTRPVERFLAIICARPMDPLQLSTLRAHFPTAEVRAGRPAA